jgi:hypothetical protein
MLSQNSETESEYLKEGGGFVHKSALLEFLLRTPIVKYGLIDLDELNIFCDGTWSPEHFLKKFYAPRFVTLLHKISPFHTNQISLVV